VLLEVCPVVIELSLWSPEHWFRACDFSICSGEFLVTCFLDGAVKLTSSASDAIVEPVISEPFVPMILQRSITNSNMTNDETYATDFAAVFRFAYDVKVCRWDL